MNKYYIYRIEKNGEPKKTQTTHAHTIDSAWNSNKSWHISGLFLVTNADGSEAGTFTLNRNDAPAASPETPKKLCVCERCLMAIESREGRQATYKIYLDDDDPRACDWCEDDGFTELYEIQ